MEQLLDRILGRPLLMSENGTGNGASPPVEPAAEPAPVSDEETVRDDDTPAAEESDATTEGEDGDVATEDAAPATKAAPVDDTDEVDFGTNQKFKVPKEVKTLIEGFRASITRKEQDVASLRRALEMDAAQQATIARERVVKVGQLAHAEDMLSRYQQIDWNILRAADPELAQSRLIEKDQWKDVRDNIYREVAGLDAQEAQARNRRALDAQQENILRIQQAQRTLQGVIPTWEADKAKVAEFVMQKLGFTSQELTQLTDPRFGMLMHAAWREAELTQKQQAAAQQRQKAKTVDTAPLATVTGTGSTAPRKSLDQIAKTDDMSAFIATYKKTYGGGRRR